VLLGGDGTGTSGGAIDTDTGTELTLTGALTQDPSPSATPATLTKDGAGTLILTSDASTYSGGTTITTGTLQLGDGGTTGSILGNVVDNGTLAFDRVDSPVFGGTITGTGTVEQIGAGTTILTADSSYSGGTTITAGTLQLGNGGTTGSITGDVTDNGTLAFDRSDTLTFSGVVTGSGALSQIGTGTTILTADSTYGGGTTITAGTLQLGNGGTTGSITGDISDNGMLAVNRSDIYSITGVISGSGALSQVGTGATILANDNTYTGDTTIAAGTLQIGNGGTAGSISSDSDILNSGVLAFDRSDTTVYGGQIRGSGSLHQIGAGTGTLILAGNNTYGGGTTIDTGTTLQLGNGGTTGSIVGSITDNGTLTFNRTDLMPLIGTISGTGDIVQLGSGTTTLHGANSYSGTTTVQSGALFIDGDQTNATGPTTVLSGGTLGGIGTIGGSVVVAGGGTLAPGDVGADAGALTINQDLTLDSGSQLAYNFGQTNVVGGAFNDLTTVHGNLASNGAVLNVTTTAGGTFDPGVYRVISYDGTWSRSGISVGTIPSPDFILQTAVDHQVNLVNTAGYVFNFWDGPTSPDDATIQGGDGIWQNSTGNSNWTDQTGNANAPFADAAFAVFMAAPGHVRIDNDLGAVMAGGMQFATDGYVIEGAELTLVASAGSPGATIRVGDGTTLSSGYTATIDSVIVGAAGLIKTDLGTLVLTADNAYAGGTSINGGVVEVSRDTNLGAAGTPLALDNGGTLRTTEDMTLGRQTTLGANGGTFEVVAGTNLSAPQTITGAGRLTKTGDGTLTVTAANTYAGGTTISGGALQIGDGDTSGDILGSVELDSGALIFDRSDTYTFAGGIFGAGSVSQIGSGTTVLTGPGTYFGPTDVASGTLQAGGANIFSPLSDYMVAAGATLSLDGFDQTVHGLTNAGTVDIGSVPGTVLTVAGNYVGLGGTLVFDTFLGDSSSPSDKLVIDAGAATGSTLLAPVLTGPGALTTGDGILIISAINGATTEAGAFAVDRPIVAGPYQYTLYRGGLNGSAPESWFLRSTRDCSLAPSAPACVSPPTPPGTTPPGPPPPGQVPDYRPETSLDAVIPELALDYGNSLLDSFDRRMGGQRGLADDPVAANQLIWARLIGTSGAVDGGAAGIFGDRGPSYDYAFSAMQVGADIYRGRRPDGSFDNAGFYLAYGGATADVTHFDGSRAGTDRLDALTAGGYWTHQSPEGWYIDSLVQATHYAVRSTGRLGETNSSGVGVAASVESGYPIALGDGVLLEPQGQLTYQAIRLDDFADPGATIGFDGVQSLVGRVGVRLSRSWSLGDGANDNRKATVWVRPSLTNEFLGQPRTLFSSDAGPVPFQTNTSGPSLKLDAGFDVQLTDSVSFYGSIDVQHRLDGGDRSVGGQIGFKAKF
jgi:fibronectin-binding autotransporter adhesin